MKRIVVTGLGLALVFAAGGLAPPRHAEAKTPAWAITGGKLGESVYWLWADWENGTGDELPGPDAARVDAVTAPKGLVYDIYASWGVFAMPYQSWQGPRFRYYAAHRAIEVRSEAGGEPEWWRPSEPYVRMIEKAIDDGLALKTEGKLPTSPTVADWLHRGMDTAVYGFRPLQSLESRQTYGSDRSSFVLSGNRAADFALKGLADTVSRAPAGETTDAPAYEVSVAGSNWGGSLGYYSPPIDGHPGRFWAESRSISEPSPYFAATPALDALLAEAIAEAGKAAMPGNAAPTVTLEAAMSAEDTTTLTAPTTGGAAFGLWWWIVLVMALSGGIVGAVALPRLRSGHRPPTTGY